MIFTAEVIETKKAFKSNQKDSKGRILPLGSILLRGNSNSLDGQVANFYARPAVFNKRIPFIGEHVFILEGPVHDNSAANRTASGFMYWTSYNATDDLALNQLPKLWKRSRHYNGSSPTIKADRSEIGYNFVKNSEIKLVRNLQPFEGDTLMEGRMGQSIRFGSTIKKNLSVYNENPNWKGSSNGDPLTIIRVFKPTNSTKRNVDTSDVSNPAAPTYQIENINEDSASIYLCSDQKLEKLKPGFKKNKDASKISKYQGAQIVGDSERVVLNAKKDNIILIGKKKAILTADQVIFQSKEHYVDLDDLMNFIKSHLSELQKLTTGSKFFTTMMGPTSIATNVGDVTKLLSATFPQKFKI